MGCFSCGSADTPHTRQKYRKVEEERIWNCEVWYRDRVTLLVRLPSFLQICIGSRVPRRSKISKNIHPSCESSGEAEKSVKVIQL